MKSSTFNVNRCVFHVVSRVAGFTLPTAVYAALAGLWSRTILFYFALML